MLRSKKFLNTTLPTISSTIPLIILLIVAAGCSAVQPTALHSTSTPPQPSVTPALTPTTAPVPTTSGASVENPLIRLANSCMLINSNDLAHLFPPHNEIVRDPPATGSVGHPPFSDAAATGTETTCTFYDFHQPGQLAGWLYQVTYLVDVPDPAQAQAWSQAWKAAKSKSGQPVNGLGDEAFTSGANLYIKLGNNYISFESAGTQVDTNTAAGVEQLLAYEKQLAEAGLSRFN